MNTSRKIGFPTLVLITTVIISSCSVSFRHSNRTASNVSGTGFVDDSVVEAPIFDPAGGTVKWGTNISICSQTSGSSTYYNIGDGTQADPAPSIDLLYDESNKPIMLNSNVIKARSFKVGYIPSDVVSSSYEVPPQILIGGVFSHYSDTTISGIALLNLDGSLDSDFTNNVSVENAVMAIANQPNGKIVIAGGFTHYSGTLRNHIARLSIDGTLDSTFDPGQLDTGEGIILIAIQKDGKILIVDETPNYYFNLLRLNNDGSLDSTFNNGINLTYINALALQSDGKILVAGGFQSYNGVNIKDLVRLNSDGSIDTTFNFGGGVTVSGINSLAVQDDGRILAGAGNFRYNNVNLGCIIRLNKDGSLDPSFNEGGSGITQGPASSSVVYAITPMKDGNILVGGLFSYYNGVHRESIIKLNSDGILDQDFVPAIQTRTDFYKTNYIYSIAIQQDGKILIGGSFYRSNGTDHLILGRLNPVDGSYDDSLPADRADGQNFGIFSILTIGN